MKDKYDTRVDRTAAEMANEYLQRAYELFKSVHPECGGFTAEVVEVGDDGSVQTKIDLLVPQGTRDREEGDGDYVII